MLRQTQTHIRAAANAIGPEKDGTRGDVFNLNETILRSRFLVVVTSGERFEGSVKFLRILRKQTVQIVYLSVNLFIACKECSILSEIHGAVHVDPV